MDALDRLYWRLVETLRHEGATMEGALTVARLYQSLIPYRGVRAELGLLELAQYEHALLRLLAGERGYLQLDPASAQEELHRELGSPNPILGLYRDYADAVVRVSRPRSESSTAGEAESAPPAEPLRAPVPVAVPAEPTPATAPPEAVAAAQGAACTSCLQALPRGRDARFCPYCGTRQPYRCRSCGEALEEQWSFCIDCGTPRQATTGAPLRG